MLQYPLIYLQSVPVGFTIPNAFRVTDADTGDNAITTITCFVDPANDQVSLRLPLLIVFISF